MSNINNVLEFLEIDRKQQLDFFNDIIENKKMSEESIVNMISSVMNSYNEKMFATIETIQKQKDDLNEKDMNKYYETKLKEQENYNKMELEKHRTMLEYSIKPKSIGNTITDFMDSFTRSAEAINNINSEK